MTLRPLRTADIPSLAAWLPRAAADAGCERWAREDALRAAVGREDALAAEDCFVAYELGSPQPQAATVQLLAVAPGRRRLGTGSLAALALERRLRLSASGIYVLVPARIGLALYFWLRLGYRPLTQAEWPARLERGAAVWMMRGLG